MTVNANLGAYTKAIVSAALAVALAYRQVASDGVVSTAEWWSLVVVAVVAGGTVFAIPNVPANVAKYAKAITAAIAAAVGVFAAAAAGGNAIDTAVIVNAAVAFFGALGVVAVAPNAATSDSLITDPSLVPAGAPADTAAHADSEPVDNDGEGGFDGDDDENDHDDDCQVSDQEVNGAIDDDKAVG